MQRYANIVCKLCVSVSYINIIIDTEKFNVLKVIQ